MKQNVVFTSDMDELVERFLPLIRWTIHSYIRCREDVVGLSYDDLVQEGCIALCGAVSSYRPDKGGLQTYAVTVVRNRLIVYCRDVMAKENQLPTISFDSLAEKGCKVIIFVEYVPVTEESRELAPTDTEREYLQRRIEQLRETHSEMVYIAFPGDEKSSGGCVAAGRGFFHINSHGGAEPCPFSPYSDINVRDCSLKAAMNSPLFRKLRDEGYLLEGHSGGCVLYEKRELVQQIING